MVKISVIIPCFNVTNLIDNCLKSLDNQEFRDFEVILVDDCSTDNTFDYLQSQQDKYSFKIIVLRNEVNSGPSFSRKYGAENANSVYIAFCDADDTYDQDFLINIHQNIQLNQPDLVAVGYKVLLGNNRIINHQFTEKDKLSIDKESAFTMGITSLCCLCLKKQLFLSLNHPNLRNGEDMAIIPVLLAKAKVINVLSGIPYNYINRKGSASNTANRKVVLSLLDSFKYVEENMPSEYKVFVEYLGIQRILYGALLNEFKHTSSYNFAKDIVEEFKLKYPNWKQNKYFKTISLSKRFFICLVHYRLYFLAYMFSRIHRILSNG